VSRPPSLVMMIADDAEQACIFAGSPASGVTSPLCLRCANPELIAAATFLPTSIESNARLSCFPNAFKTTSSDSGPSKTRAADCSKPRSPCCSLASRRLDAAGQTIGPAGRVGTAKRDAVACTLTPITGTTIAAAANPNTVRYNLCLSLAILHLVPAFLTLLRGAASGGSTPRNLEAV